MLRVDFGVPIKPRVDEPRSLWFFSIGHAF
jgi:hypothetical protein